MRGMSRSGCPRSQSKALSSSRMSETGTSNRRKRGEEPEEEGAGAGSSGDVVVEDEEGDVEGIGMSRTALISRSRALPKGTG